MEGRRTLKRKRPASVFDAFRAFIINELQLRSSVPFVAREINRKFGVDVSVGGLQAYIKREKLRDELLSHS